MGKRAQNAGFLKRASDALILICLMVFLAGCPPDGEKPETTADAKTGDGPTPDPEVTGFGSYLAKAGEAAASTPTPTPAADADIETDVAPDSGNTGFGDYSPSIQ